MDPDLENWLVNKFNLSRYRLHDGSLRKLKKLNSALDSDTDLTLRSTILRLEYTMQCRIFS